MPSLAARVTREIYRRELIPARGRWWMAAAGMIDWLRLLSKRLGPHLGEAVRPVMRSMSGRLFERRYDDLRASFPSLPPRSEDTRAPALLFAGLYRLWTAPKSAWVLDGIGGGPRSAPEHLRAQKLARLLPVEARWREVATHLGELLIVLTEGLPEHLPHARKILGDICFEMGAIFGEQAKRFHGFDERADPAEAAIEVLRMSEYIFHVNPKHWGETDPAKGTGWLEGSACLWYPRPGWNGAHCGIFGQFQAGISSVFGLRYHLSKTIPKHGGDTCRIDLKPIPLRKNKDGAAAGQTSPAT